MANKPSTNECMLVSDSNELGGQYDSKKLNFSELVELAQDSLFNKYLRIMSTFLTTIQYNNYIQIINQRLNTQGTEWGKAKNGRWTGKFTPVDGQVILIRKADVPRGNTPLQYLLNHWNVSSEYTVTQIQNCMLRGVVSIHDQTVKNPDTINVSLTDDNIPPHMHHPGITENANIGSMRDSSQSGDKVWQRAASDVSYDMFYNDSISTGLTKNELDGVVDGFDVQPSGDESVSHNNIPAIDVFYAFEIRKNG